MLTIQQHRGCNLEHGNKFSNFTTYDNAQTVQITEDICVLILNKLCQDIQHVEHNSAFECSESRKSVVFEIVSDFG